MHLLKVFAPCLLVMLTFSNLSCSHRGSNDSETLSDAAATRGTVETTNETKPETPGRPTRLAMKPKADDGPASRDQSGDGKDWTLAVGADGRVDIRFKGAPIIKTSYLFWGAKWAWAGSVFRMGPMKQKQAELTGDVKALGVTMKGAIRVTDPRTIHYEYELTTEKDVPSAIGGGLQWDLKLDSPAFGAKPRKPELLAGNAGWVWQVGPTPDQSITVRFEPPAAKVYFERNQANTIRTFILADQLAAGRSTISYTVTLPKGGAVVPAPRERYGSDETASWFNGVLNWDSSPIDLSYLNKDDRPAGRHGPVGARGDQLVFADGTPARFWGTNLTANALYRTPRENVPRQAHRIAQLGYNLIRIHHHDSPWASPNIFVKTDKSTLRLDPKSLDSLDYWVKCLKEEGIYIWLDMHVQRALREDDPISQGVEEIRKAKGSLKGFSYFNPDVLDLMRRFQREYVDRVNSYTKTAYKDEPALMAILLTNENDLTHHFGHMMLRDKGNPVHSARFYRDVAAFAEETGLPSNRLWQTWLPGPSKILLNELEHRFNRPLIDDLRGIGFRTPIVTTSSWGFMRLSSLPALTEGDIIDAHAYGRAEALSVNPRYEANLIPWIGAAQVYGKPLTITEWNIEFPQVDRFTGPLYIASTAALQGWDAPMIYAFSQSALTGRTGVDRWATNLDPAITGIMPAAAVAYRQGHISPARDEYCLNLDRATLFDRDLSPDSSATIRTLIEQSKLSIGLPKVKELPWFEGATPSSSVKIVTDPDHDFIPEGRNFVRSDTGEIVRDWKEGIQTIDTPKTQAVSGWIGAKSQRLSSATFLIDSPNKAVIALTSIDNRPLSTSNFILVSAIARAQPNKVGGRDQMPFRSEPVVGTISLKTTNHSLQLLTLGSDGRVVKRATPARNADGLSFSIPTSSGTHWYVLKGASGETQGP